MNNPLRFENAFGNLGRGGGGGQVISGCKKKNNLKVTVSPILNL